MNFGAFEMLDGIRILSSPLAREVRDEFRVEQFPIRKRRRNWRVVKIHIDKPGAYMLGENTLIAHPETIEKLKKLYENNA